MRPKPRKKEAAPMRRAREEGREAVAEDAGDNRYYVEVLAEVVGNA